jgi:glycosyltransferase involved in cell wall biosynthesis
MSLPASLSGSVAILHDMTEEGWHSMDQMANLLTTRLPILAPGLTVTPVRHPLVRIASSGPLAGLPGMFLADRMFNRLVLYPRRVRASVRGRFDLYHVVDHSYAQLALDLPQVSTIVTCHDVDAFRSLVEPASEPRPLWFRALTRRILRGLRHAEIVVCGSRTAGDDLVRFHLVHPSRLRVVPNGIDPGLLVEPGAGARDRAAELLPARRDVFDVLHVGSDIPRKRLDRLIEIVSDVRNRGHRVRLVRVGPPLRRDTRRRALELGLADSVELPFLDREVLRAVYDRTALLLLTSDREGYGLPVLEAFAAGKPVVASDIPAFRESSGGLATLVPPDSRRDWVDAVERTLSAPDPDGRLAAARRAHAASRTWDDHIRGLLPIYAELLDGVRSEPRPATAPSVMHPAAAHDRSLERDDPGARDRAVNPPGRRPDDMRPETSDGERRRPDAPEPRARRR